MIRWLEYESRINPETGEGFVYPSSYRKLQYGVYETRQVLSETGQALTLNELKWHDVPVVKS
jgi:hypothetical protein